MYLVYRALRYFYRFFVGSQNSQRIRQESKEIIDVDYEEVKDEDKQQNKS
jgi:hypothetical protein